MSNRKRTCPRYRPGCTCGTCVQYASVRATLNGAKGLKPATVFEAIVLVGHDEDFQGRKGQAATTAAPGSREKLEILRQRIERGEELFHPDDRADYEGAKPGCVRPSPQLPIAAVQDRKAIQVLVCRGVKSEDE